MNPTLSRRQFLGKSAAAAGVALVPHWTKAADRNPGKFSFVLLGDLHFDQLDHHDMNWVRKEKPNDVRQIENYSRITREVSPLLFKTVRETIAELNRTPATRVAFVLQAGDVVEGLCGNEELAVQQNSDAITFLRNTRLDTPFLFTKGNHDITGPGAIAAFHSVFHPFLTTQAHMLNPGGADVTSGSYTVTHGNAQFAFFDAYESGKSLEWFEAVTTRRTAEHLFVVVHPPVVPYGARSTWHIFAHAKEAARREKFLALLGDQHAMVLGGHIHKFNLLNRRAGKGRFTQLALSSVLSTATVKPKDLLTGLEQYTPDQIKVEPTFSPANEVERRQVYETERHFVDTFEYADVPGYAIVTVDGRHVRVRLHAGAGGDVWRSFDLTARSRI